ncbi:hypothetical protein COEREDRAFT_79761 [Coemansia reversa NRRL 1564]|uniref:CUE domain-containing protein n=1 Tax=Coemansia reversa (strain ATCC 12441 / NRRL 1564) TaxID=763665 RepID=A0A2G5BIF2_COERN|nr:hypothetical protein COEREDRAFT_79761 [Coemansia reversa NRRL 1564]|eukprot:PIA18779.1 hypothetical protein COEREDRAFT_79761 [Coemansia reversa NRRL 1564]
MNDSAVFFIVLGVVFMVLRWLLGQGGNEQRQGAGARAQRRTHIVRREHVEAIQAMFPDIPETAIRADLGRTGSPAITTDNILRNGGTLPLPPVAGTGQRDGAPGNESSQAASDFPRSHGGPAEAEGEMTGMSSGVILNAIQSPLVNRLRVATKGDTEPLPQPPPRIWETDSDKREDILRKRKEFMLMEARKKYLEKQSSSGLEHVDSKGPASHSGNCNDADVVDSRV